MSSNDVKRFLQAETKFSFGESATPHTANDFWQWAFSNMDVPVLRGVLIEYLVATKLIAECDAIVGKTVRRLTTYTPRKRDLTESISKYYQSQPHGDVFDLQLTWGTTVEIKSTASPANWRLNKTCRWNIIKNRNIAEKIFPAQIYILAEMKSSIAFNDRALDVGNIVFHIRTGEELDKLALNQLSIGYSKFVGVESERRSCGYDELANVLEELQAERLLAIEQKIRPEWRLEGIQAKGTHLALAVETSGGVNACWYREEKQNNKYDYLPVGVGAGVEMFESPWRDGVNPTWRDWEAAGFSYVPIFEAKQVEEEPEELVTHND